MTTLTARTTAPPDTTEAPDYLDALQARGPDSAAEYFALLRYAARHDLESAARYADAVSK